MTNDDDDFDAVAAFGPPPDWVGKPLPPLPQSRARITPPEIRLTAQKARPTDRERVEQWLRAYTENNPFLVSCRDNYLLREDRSLSDKQVQAIAARNLP